MGTGPPSVEGDSRRSHRWASGDSTSELGLGGRGQSRWALGQRKGACPCQEHRGLSLLVSDAWEALFRPLSSPGTCVGAAILQRRKLRNPETVSTPRATVRPLSDTLQPALPAPSPPSVPSPRMCTLPPKAGRAREPQTQLHDSNNDKHLRVGSGSGAAAPSTPLPLILQRPSALGTMSDPFQRCKKLAQSLLISHMARRRRRGD